VSIDEDNLRKLAQQRETAVTRKIARIKKQTGAIVSGSEYDPRVGRQALKDWSPQALRIHIYELNMFMSRNNQFVSGRNNIPLPRSEWNEFVSNQQAVKARAQKVENAMEELLTFYPIPDSKGSTSLKEFQSWFHRKPLMNQSFTPYSVYNRKSTDFGSVKSLRDMILNLRQKNTDEYFWEATERAREQATKSFQTLGRKDMIEMIDDLSDYQFAAMWYGDRFQGTFWIAYETQKRINEGYVDFDDLNRTEDEVQSNLAESIEIIKHAKEDFPEEAPF
jgi:hypothetical protein